MPIYDALNGDVELCFNFKNHQYFDAPIPYGDDKMFQLYNLEGATVNVRSEITAQLCKDITFLLYSNIAFRNTH